MADALGMIETKGFVGMVDLITSDGRVGLPWAAGSLRCPTRARTTFARVDRRGTGPPVRPPGSVGEGPAERYAGASFHNLERGLRCKQGIDQVGGVAS